ncbi:MAG TPA: hypothetical protein VK081_13305, partial [Planctomycetota bacterium]|nr:hypothetical protein [Planctomycetota bacterium]
MTNASPELPVAQPASWREAGALVVALVAFVCISDVQGVLWHRSEYRSAAHWVLPGVSYAFAAGLALWRWDWVVRVALSGRFVLLLAGAIAAIWAASAVPDARATAERREGVPVLRAGERERRTLVERTPVAAMVDWQTPQISHMDARQAQQAASQDSSFVHELPTGWTRMAPSAMRLVNLRVAGDPRAECYLTSLPGAAGGLLDNVNRWRSQ